MSIISDLFTIYSSDFNSRFGGFIFYSRAEAKYCYHALDLYYGTGFYPCKAIVYKRKPAERGCFYALDRNKCHILSD